MNDFPDNTDTLFKEELDPKRGAWLKNPSNKFFLYSEGYKKAGDVLFSYCIANEFYSNFLVYPMIFDYRQYIELRLKELITMSYSYLSIVGDFKDIHDLKRLWSSYRNDLLPNIIDEDATLLDNVERLILEFNQIDPGFNFRYPVSRRPNRQETLKMDTIDLQNFKTTFDKLASFFEYQWDMIDHYQDLKNEQLADMMSEMYRENGY